MQAELDSLNVRTPSMEANVASLSGGNQQKVVMSRALLRKPAMLIADEPTQGVDVGARAEIYRIIREVAASGIPVIVASSDAHELEGLCDRVIVMSRGQSVVELTGDDVTEERIVRAAVSATTQQDYQEGPVSKGRSSTWGRFLQGDYAPVLILAARNRRARCLHLLEERQIHQCVQHHLRPDARGCARLHCDGPNSRLDGGGDRSVGRSPGGTARRRGVLLSRR